MNGIGRPLLLAFASALHPRMLWMMLWPLLVAMGLWITVAAVFWAQGVAWLVGLMQQWILSSSLLVSWDLSGAAAFVAKILILISLFPLIQLTALLILGIFSMSKMVEHVAGRHYPDVARRRGGSFAGSLWNSVVALAGLVVMFLLSLPLLIVPPLWAVAPVAVLGWVNQRVLRYDALAEHATAEEMETIFRVRRGPLYLLGVILALLAYVPVLGFFAPVLFGLAFIHFGLIELREMRDAPIEGVVTGRSHDSLPPA